MPNTNFNSKFFSKETVEKIRNGFFSASYFSRTKEILEKEGNRKIVTMQVFQRNKGSILCGVEEVRELLRVGTGYFDNEITNNQIPNPKQIPNSKFQNPKWIDMFDSLKIESLQDGNRLKAGEAVMHLAGPYVYFAHLESIYLGILARRTLVATNTRNAVEAANNKSVIFFADRFDYFQNQEGDGFAAKTGGASGVCTPAHASWWGGEASGTIPHSLIAINNGNTVEAAKQFSKHFPGQNLIVLVDFHNDCVNTALETARALGKKLWGVRLDTASDLVDKSLEKGVGGTRLPASPKLQRGEPARQGVKGEDLCGVNPTLVKLVREALDREGFGHVKIVVSGGFDEQKISLFEKEKAPVDVYGVGSSLLKGHNDFTADIVMVEGKKIAKVGREYKKTRE